MPDRAVIAILPAVSLGFIGGLIATMLQLERGATWTVGIAGAVLVAIAGLSSVFGGKGAAGEKGIVGLLRGACAVGLYACVFLFIATFLDGNILGSLPWFVLGGALGGVLSQLRVRDRGELSTSTAD